MAENDENKGTVQAMKANMPRSHGFILNLIAVLFASLTLIADPVASNAQAPYLWSLPEQIPEYYYLGRAPLMVAGKNRSVHAFNMETLGGNTFVVMSRTWSLEQGWSSPVDILLPGYFGGGPDLLDVILDEWGAFHLLFFARALQAGELYYSTAPAVEADHPGAWSHPILITSEAGPLADGQIIEVDSDRLVVIFSGQRYGSGLYEIHSDDRGATWSTASLVQRSSEENLNPGGIRVALDSYDRIHVVWHMDNVSGLAEETWYARLSHDLSTWEYLQKLSQKDDEQEYNGEPSIVLIEDEVLVVYYDDYPPTRFVRRSMDGGATWSPPARPFPHQGGYGRVDLVKDSQGTVHMLLGNRLQNPEIHGMWYSRLVGDAWLPLDPIISGPATNSFDPSWPEAVVVQGNILLAAWSNDVGREYQSEPWYSYTFLDVPELPKEPFRVRAMSTETEDPGRLDVSVVATQIVPTIGTTVPADSSSLRSSTEGHTPGTPILFGAIPALVIVLTVVYIRIGQHRSG